MGYPTEYEVSNDIGGSLYRDPSSWSSSLDGIAPYHDNPAPHQLVTPAQSVEQALFHSFEDFDTSRSGQGPGNVVGFSANNYNPNLSPGAEDPLLYSPESATQGFDEGFDEFVAGRPSDFQLLPSEHDSTTDLIDGMFHDTSAGLTHSQSVFHQSDLQFSDDDHERDHDQDFAMW
jgi:hypothetical protein